MPLAPREYESEEDKSAPVAPDASKTNPNPNAPMTEDEMVLYLTGKLSSSYKSKFKVPQAPEKNAFSISTLTAGPGTALAYRKQNVKESVVAEAVFNTAMFRGSAIHKYSEGRLPDWFPYETIVDKHKCPNCGFNHAVPGTEKPIYVRDVFPYDWKDGVTKDIVIYGHPDFTKDSMVLEFKTMDAPFTVNVKSKEYLEHKSYVDALLEKKEKYRQTVIKKAKFQVGCYARLLQKELGRHMYAYVVVISNKLDVHLLSEDEAWHGLNYVKWSARECAKRIDEEESKK